MKKRYTYKRSKPGEIRISYGSLEGTKEVVYCYDDSDLEGASRIGKPTINLLMLLLENTAVHEGKTIMQILDERGYDITTFDLKIKRKSKEDKGVPTYGNLRQPLYTMKL